MCIRDSINTRYTIVLCTLYEDRGKEENKRDAHGTQTIGKISFSLTLYQTLIRQLYGAELLVI